MLYFSEKHNAGVTCIKASNTRLVVGYLDGVLEIYQSEPRNGLKTSLSFGSSTSCLSPSETHLGCMLCYNILCVIRAHRQPISVLQIDAYHVITGSLDHVIKVYSIETGQHMYTLNGHFGGITQIQIDQVSLK